MLLHSNSLIQSRGLKLLLANYIKILHMSSENKMKHHYAPNAWMIERRIKDPYNWRIELFVQPFSLADRLK